MRRRAAALAVPLTALSLVVSSCGSLPEEWRTPAFLRMGEDELDSRLPEVSGEVGEAPDVVFPDQEPPDEPIDGIVQEGAGEDGLVRSDDLVVANVATFQWTGPGQGETVEEQSSYKTGAPDLIRMAEMPEEITSPLVSQPIGSRAVYVMPEASPEERAQAEEMGQEVPEGATVLVIDLMERFGTGAVVPGQQTEDLGEDMPTVAQDGHSEPEITIPEDEEAPDELVTEHLIEGDGDEVEEGQQVIVQYTGVQWEPDEDGNHEPFDSSWANGGAPSVPSTRHRRPRRVREVGNRPSPRPKRPLTKKPPKKRKKTTRADHPSFPAPGAPAMIARAPGVFVPTHEYHCAYSAGDSRGGSMQRRYCYVSGIRLGVPALEELCARGRPPALVISYTAEYADSSGFNHFEDLARA